MSIPSHKARSPMLNKDQDNIALKRIVSGKLRKAGLSDEGQKRFVKRERRNVSQRQD